MKLGLLYLALIFFSVSCYEGRGAVNFDTDPSIFRGVWNGQAKLENQTQTVPVKLDLNAVFTDTKNYSVSGLITLASDAALNVSGDVQGSSYETYVRAPLPPQIFLEIKENTTRIGFLKCYWFKNFDEKRCEIGISSGTRVGNYTVENLKKP